jgi:hypothetical protein
VQVLCSCAHFGFLWEHVCSAVQTHPRVAMTRKMLISIFCCFVVSACTRTDPINHCFLLRRASDEDPEIKSFLFWPFRRDSHYGTGQRLYFVAVSLNRTDIHEPFRFTRYAFLCLVCSIQTNRLKTCPKLVNLRCP